MSEREKFGMCLYGKCTNEGVLCQWSQCVEHCRTNHKDSHSFPDSTEEYTPVEAKLVSETSGF